ncbi:MAG: 1-deoxy-D-xylulose-5-phosphate reductoisomerase [Candidatus Omnitrophica bacterium]|nr:1-deoxy-D-xylulose-5-phosphate reductoisomerase [Candidatus Omnitrophota bacterium]
MKKISIIGSTGSIGVNTLRVLRAHPGKFQVITLAARTQAEALLKQAIEFRPKLVCIYASENFSWLRDRLKSYQIRVVSGDEGLLKASAHPDADQVIFALVGAAGLQPIFQAIQAKKNVAIANKEPLVMAGELLMKQVKKQRVKLLPIDSEHSGLWQCLEGYGKNDVKKLVLTSSGGPFWKRKKSFQTISLEEALKHPRWKMGPKITIDSATLMNKGLEVIEASNLFGVPADRVDVVIHPEAIIHALIEFVDGSHLAQLGITDMRLPIQYALSYPSRFVNSIPSLELTKLESIRFYKPDRKRFPCLTLGYEAKRIGGTMPAVLNAANEVAVQKFMDGKIKFTQIYETISKSMRKHKSSHNPSLSDVLEADRWARTEAESLC